MKFQPFLGSKDSKKSRKIAVFWVCLTLALCASFGYLNPCTTRESVHQPFNTKSFYGSNSIRTVQIISKGSVQASVVVSASTKAFPSINYTLTSTVPMPSISFKAINNTQEGIFGLEIEAEQLSPTSVPLKVSVFLDIPFAKRNTSIQLSKGNIEILGITEHDHLQMVVGNSGGIMVLMDKVYANYVSIDGPTSVRANHLSSDEIRLSFLDFARIEGVLANYQLLTVTNVSVISATLLPEQGSKTYALCNPLYPSNTRVTSNILYFTGVFVLFQDHPYWQRAVL
jgi:hypothetical protein